MQGHRQAKAGERRRCGRRSTRDQHLAPPRRPPQRRRAHRRVRGQQAHLHRHGALQGRRALRPHRRQEPLLGEGSGEYVSNHDENRRALPQPRGHPPRLEARELRVEDHRG